MSAGRWRFIFLVIFGLLGFAGMAWADTLTALGLTLGLAFSLEAGVVGMALAAPTAAPTIAAFSQAMAGSIAVGGGIGAVNLAALGLVAGVLGLVGIALVGGLVAFVVVPAIVAAARGPAGASGEMTDDMAAANAAANAEANAAANLAAAIASFPPMPPPLPTVRFSVNPATGELTITDVGIDTAPGACCPGFTTNQDIVLSPATGTGPTVTVTPGPSDLPAIGESVPGSESDVSLDAAVNASAEGGEYGRIDGICRHYATGLSCAAYREHEREEYAEHAAILWPATGWLILLVSLGLAGHRFIRRSA